MNLDKISYELYLNGLNEPYDDSIDPSILPIIEKEIGEVVPIEWVVNTKPVYEIYGNISKIGDYGLIGRSNLTNVNLPVCSYVGEDAFAYCGSLAEINLPACTSIGTQAFYQCRSLTNIDLPVCSYVGDWGAFAYCSSLTEINLPACKSIGDFAFAVCLNLTNINLPVCSYIGKSAFYQCSSLTNVSLPTCTIIGSYAFWSCRSLESIYLTNSSVVLLLNENAFYYTPMSDSSYLSKFGSIYVPASLLSQYKVAENWSQYSDRFVGITEE